MLALKSFSRNQGGNTVMIFALVMLPLMSLAGAAIDFERQNRATNAAQAALDAAILDAALRPDAAKGADLTAATRSFYDENISNSELDLTSFKVTRQGDRQLVASLSGNVRTTMLGIIGIKSMNVSVNSEVQLSGKRFEVALALDTTGSMAGDKLAKLKAASIQLVDRLAVSDSPKIALVPFSAVVNVDPSNATQTWIDIDGVSDRSADNLVPGLSRLKVIENVGETWEGCVEARKAPFDVTDEEPRGSDPDSLFPPLFSPDEGDDRTQYGNSYLIDAAPTGTALENLADITRYGVDPAEVADPTKWTPVTKEANYQYFSDTTHPIGPNFDCSAHAIVPLTTNYANLKTEINALKAEGSTNITEGLTWAWRVLSKDKPFTQGASYSDPKIQKVIILLSDGNNHVNAKSDGLGSNYSAYGYIGNDNLVGVTAGSTQADIGAAMDARTALACQNAKNEGIIIYTIRLELSDARSDGLLRDCATSPAHYLDVPDADQLAETFEQISTRILNIYLSK